jgi:hypothetical protein
MNLENLVKIKEKITKTDSKELINIVNTNIKHPDKLNKILEITQNIMRNKVEIKIPNIIKIKLIDKLKKERRAKELEKQEAIEQQRIARKQAARIAREQKALEQQRIATEEEAERIAEEKAAEKEAESAAQAAERAAEGEAAQEEEAVEEAAEKEAEAAEEEEAEEAAEKKEEAVRITVKQVEEYKMNGPFIGEVINDEEEKIERVGYKEQNNFNEYIKLFKYIIMDNMLELAGKTEEEIKSLIKNWDEYFMENATNTYGNISGRLYNGINTDVDNFRDYIQKTIRNFYSVYEEENKIELKSTRYRDKTEDYIIYIQCSSHATSFYVNPKIEGGKIIGYNVIYFNSGAHCDYHPMTGRENKNNIVETYAYIMNKEMITVERYDKFIDLITTYDYEKIGFNEFYCFVIQYLYIKEENMEYWMPEIINDRLEIQGYDEKYLESKYLSEEDCNIKLEDWMIMETQTDGNCTIRSIFSHYKTYLYINKIDKFEELYDMMYERLIVYMGYYIGDISISDSVDGNDNVNHIMVFKNKIGRCRLVSKEIKIELIEKINKKEVDMEYIDKRVNNRSIEVEKYQVYEYEVPKDWTKITVLIEIFLKLYTQYYKFTDLYNFRNVVWEAYKKMGNVIIEDEDMDKLYECINIVFAMLVNKELYCTRVIKVHITNQVIFIYSIYNIIKLIFHKIYNKTENKPETSVANNKKNISYVFYMLDNIDWEIYNEVIKNKAYIIDVYDDYDLISEYYKQYIRRITAKPTLEVELGSLGLCNETFEYVKTQDIRTKGNHKKIKDFLILSILLAQRQDTISEVNRSGNSIDEISKEYKIIKDGIKMLNIIEMIPKNIKMIDEIVLNMYVEMILIKDNISVGERYTMSITSYIYYNYEKIRENIIKCMEKIIRISYYNKNVQNLLVYIRYIKNIYYDGDDEMEKLIKDILRNMEIKGVKMNIEYLIKMDKLMIKNIINNGEEWYECNKKIMEITKYNLHQLYFNKNSHIENIGKIRHVNYLNYESLYHELLARILFKKVIKGDYHNYKDKIYSYVNDALYKSEDDKYIIIYNYEKITRIIIEIEDIETYNIINDVANNKIKNYLYNFDNLKISYKTNIMEISDNGKIIYTYNTLTQTLYYLDNEIEEEIEKIRNNNLIRLYYKLKRNDERNFVIFRDGKYNIIDYNNNIRYEFDDKRVYIYIKETKYELIIDNRYNIKRWDYGTDNVFLVKDEEEIYYLLVVCGINKLEINKIYNERVEDDKKTMMMIKKEGYYLIRFECLVIKLSIENREAINYLVWTYIFYRKINELLEIIDFYEYVKEENKENEDIITKMDIPAIKYIKAKLNNYTNEDVNRELIYLMDYLNKNNRKIIIKNEQKSFYIDEDIKKINITNKHNNPRDKIGSDYDIETQIINAYDVIRYCYSLSSESKKHKYPSITSDRKTVLLNYVNGMIDAIQAVENFYKSKKKNKREIKLEYRSRVKDYNENIIFESNILNNTQYITMNLITGNLNVNEEINRNINEFIDRNREIINIKYNKTSEENRNLIMRINKDLLRMINKIQRINME